MSLEPRILTHPIPVFAHKGDRGKILQLKEFEYVNKKVGIKVFHFSPLVKELFVFFPLLITVVLRYVVCNERVNTLQPPDPFAVRSIINVGSSKPNTKWKKEKRKHSRLWSKAFLLNFWKSFSV